VAGNQIKPVIFAQDISVPPLNHAEELKLIYALCLKRHVSMENIEVHSVGVTSRAMSRQ